MQHAIIMKDRSAALSAEPVQFICADCEAVAMSLDRHLPQGWDRCQHRGRTVVRCNDCLEAIEREFRARRCEPADSAVVAASVPQGAFALTIYQPWVSLIIAGAKPYEFRSYAAPFRFHHHRIVIHAAKRLMREAEIVDLVNRLEDPDRRWSTGLVADVALPLLIDALTNPRRFPLGAGLGTAILGQPRLTKEIMPGTADSGRLEHSEWAWPLTAIERFESPIMCGGAQGFWRWPQSARRVA